MMLHQPPAFVNGFIKILPFYIDHGGHVHSIEHGCLNGTPFLSVLSSGTCNAHGTEGEEE
jgi:hypothetical protein